MAQTLKWKNTAEKRNNRFYVTIEILDKEGKKTLITQIKLRINK